MNLRSLVRWDPFKEMEREMEELTERFNRILSRWPSRQASEREPMTVAQWAPVVDISETDSEYLIEAELPEVDKNNVKVTLQDGVLTIQGERKSQREEKGRKYHRVERSFGGFLRSFTLPEDADESKVKAEFKDGILRVRIPKTEKAQSKAVEVKID